MKHLFAVTVLCLVICKKNYGCKIVTDCVYLLAAHTIIDCFVKGLQFHWNTVWGTVL